VKQNPGKGYALPVLGVKPKRGWYVFWLFFKIDLCSVKPMESSRRDLSNDMAEHMPILKTNQNTYLSFIFQDRPMFSLINGSSRRDLSSDMAEHRPILKNNQNTYYPGFSFTPKTGRASPRVFCSYCERSRIDFEFDQPN